MITFGYICYAIAMFGFVYGVLGVMRAALSRRGRQN